MSSGWKRVLVIAAGTALCSMFAVAQTDTQQTADTKQTEDPARKEAFRVFDAGRYSTRGEVKNGCVVYSLILAVYSASIGSLGSRTKGGACCAVSGDCRTTPQTRSAQARLPAASVAAATRAAGRGSRPEAIGRWRLRGCARSFSTSTTSFHK